MTDPNLKPSVGVPQPGPTGPTCPYCKADPLSSKTGGPVKFGPVAAFVVFCGNQDCRALLGFLPVGIEQSQPQILRPDLKFPLKGAHGRIA